MRVGSWLQQQLDRWVRWLIDKGQHQWSDHVRRWALVDFSSGLKQNGREGIFGLSHSNVTNHPVISRIAVRKNYDDGGDNGDDCDVVVDVDDDDNNDNDDDWCDDGYDDDDEEEEEEEEEEMGRKWGGMRRRWCH